jgi:hypothetical protein
VDVVVRLEVRVMAYNPGANDAFQSGISHQVNNQHANFGSITLGDEASSADQGLQETSDAWNSQVGQVATTARSVLEPYAFDRSANGSDGRDFLPNGAFLGSSNGESSGTFNKTLTRDMAGNDSSNLP